MSQAGRAEQPIVLRPQALGSVRVAVPEYDRSAVSVGIVHFGVGGFHRAHQAMYVDRLIAEGATQWGICGVGVLPSDARMAQVLRDQDGLYTLVQKFPDGHAEAQVIGSIVKYLFAPDDPEAVIEQLADPGVRIASLTVTEGGYNISQVTGEFESDNPAIVADAHATRPATFFGLIVEALVRRRDRSIPPFTIMSCDNIPGNGEVARRALVAFAGLRDPTLARWIADQVHFPNSMVDRITPVTTDADRAFVADEFGIVAGWPVVCEPFTQWVLTDDFGLGRPPYQDAGVMLVDDVEPYELMKLRLLNASHQAICYFGHLAGYRLVHEAAQDPLFRSFLTGYMRTEAVPTLPPVPGVDLDAYIDELIERFSNAAVRDTIARLCAESSDRIPKWLVPVIRENLTAGRPVRLSAAIVASWARYAEGVDEHGDPIEVVDRRADQVMAAAARKRDDELAFLRQPQLFGDLVDQPEFTEPYLAVLRGLHRAGARATLVELTGSPRTA